MLFSSFSGGRTDWNMCSVYGVYFQAATTTGKYLPHVPHRLLTRGYVEPRRILEHYASPSWSWAPASAVNARQGYMLVLLT